MNHETKSFHDLGIIAPKIAHDLNNLIAPMLLGTELLKSSLTSEDDATILSTMEGSIRSISDLLKCVLGYGGQIELQKSSIEPAAFLGEILVALREQLPEKVEVAAAVSGSAAFTGTLRADASLLKQAILNLGLNAAEAMSDEGRLTVGIEATEVDEAFVRRSSGARIGSYVRVFVIDTGSGIPAELHEKIFEPFFTTRNLRKAPGIGLAITRAILKQHGGFVTAESAPGSGSTFAIYLRRPPLLADVDNTVTQ